MGSVAGVGVFLSGCLYGCPPGLALVVGGCVAFWLCGRVSVWSCFLCERVCTALVPAAGGQLAGWQPAAGTREVQTLSHRKHYHTFTRSHSQESTQPHINRAREREHRYRHTDTKTPTTWLETHRVTLADRAYKACTCDAKPAYWQAVSTWRIPSGC